MCAVLHSLGSDNFAGQACDSISGAGARSPTPAGMSGQQQECSHHWAFVLVRSRSVGQGQVVSQMGYAWIVRVYMP
jgi:hypothetical protein